MTATSFLRQGVFITLCLYLLSSCSSTKSCREWVLQTNEVKYPQYSSGRLFLPAESDKCKLEIEIVKSLSGTRLYINLLYSQAIPCEGDPTRTTVQVIFETEEEPWIIYPHLFEGRQRLLVPDDAADYLIQALLIECPFTIIMGRYQVEIIPKGFKKAYEDLCKISNK